MGDSHWHAGWNMPGYQPETPYERFSDRDAAVDYLTTELAHVADAEAWITADDDAPDSGDRGDLPCGPEGSVRAAAEHLREFLIAHYGGYVYLAFECTDPACEHDDQDDDSDNEESESDGNESEETR